MAEKRKLAVVAVGGNALIREKVAINFNKPNVQWLDKLTVEAAKKYLAEDQFGKGSMEPKVKAILNFLEHGGRTALVTNPDNMLRALRGETGTHFE